MFERGREGMKDDIFAMACSHFGPAHPFFSREEKGKTAPVCRIEDRLAGGGQGGRARKAGARA
ncbi:MAG: hypothetical protein BGO05_22775 [Rhizobiales bacterium 63-7]|nr:MAG: hypothetical protein BGO05_22775 [Rhizobiales bacterium 63-7]